MEINFIFFGIFALVYRYGFSKDVVECPGILIHFYIIEDAIA